MKNVVNLVLFLIDGQIGPQVIRRVILDSLGHVAEQLSDGGAIVVDGFLRAALNQLCRQENFQQTVIGDNVLLDFISIIDERVAAQRLKKDAAELGHLVYCQCPGHCIGNLGDKFFFHFLTVC